MEQRTVIKVEASFGDALCDNTVEAQLHVGREIPAPIRTLLRDMIHLDIHAVIYWEGFKFSRALYPVVRAPKQPFKLTANNIRERYESILIANKLRLKCLRAMGFEAYLDETP